MSDQAMLTLNSWVFDGATLDADNCVYSWQSIDGWFDTPDLAIVPNPRATGVQLGVVREGGRTIALNGVITDINPSVPLGQRAYAAMRRLKANCQPTFGPALLTVEEDPVAPLILTALVRLTAPIRFQIEGSGGTIACVKFQIPLLAPDPRRYDVTVKTTNLPSGTTAVTNDGDMPTPVILETVGASAPDYENTTIPGNPEILFQGAAGGDVVINTDTELVTLNGSNARSNLQLAQWWQLLPGVNNIANAEDSTITWQDAYS